MGLHFQIRTRFSLSKTVCASILPCFFKGAILSAILSTSPSFGSGSTQPTPTPTVSPTPIPQSCDIIEPTSNVNYLWEENSFSAIDDGIYAPNAPNGDYVLADKYNDQQEQIWGFQPGELVGVGLVTSVEVFVYGYADCDPPEIRVKVAGDWVASQNLNLGTTAAWTSVVIEGDWTVTEVQAIEVGIKTQDMYSSDEIQIWALYCEVCGYEPPPAPTEIPSGLSKGINPFVNNDCRFCCDSLSSGVRVMGRRNPISALSIPDQQGYKNPGFIGITGMGACRTCGGGNSWPEVVCDEYSTRYDMKVGFHFIERGEPIDIYWQGLDWLDSIGGPICLNHIDGVGITPEYAIEELWSSQNGSIDTDQLGTSWYWLPFLDVWKVFLEMDGIIYSEFLHDLPIYHAYACLTVFDVEVTANQRVQGGFPGLDITYDIDGGPSSSVLNDIWYDMTNHMVNWRNLWYPDLDPSLSLINTFEIFNPAPKANHITLRVESMNGQNWAEAYAPNDGYDGTLFWDGQWAQGGAPRWNGFDRVKITAKGYLGTEVVYCNSKGPYTGDEIDYIAERVQEPHIEGPYTGSPDYTFVETIEFTPDPPDVEFVKMWARQLPAHNHPENAANFISTTAYGNGQGRYLRGEAPYPNYVMMGATYPDPITGVYLAQANAEFTLVPDTPEVRDRLISGIGHEVGNGWDVEGSSGFVFHYNGANTCWASNLGANSSADEKVLLGYDYNFDGSLQEDEVLLATPWDLKITSKADYDNFLDETYYNSFAFLIAGSLLYPMGSQHIIYFLSEDETFDYQVGQYSQTWQSVAISATHPELEHRTGVDFNAAGIGSCPEATYHNNHSQSVQIRNSGETYETLSNFLSGKQTEIQAFFSNNPSETDETFQWTMDERINFEKESEGGSSDDWFYAIGACKLEADVEVTFERGQGTLTLTGFLASGHIIDLYDWDYGIDQHNLTPQIQAGYPTLGLSGRIWLNVWPIVNFDFYQQHFLNPPFEIDE